MLFHSAIFVRLDEQYVGCLAIVVRALKRGRRGKEEVPAGNERLRVCLCVVPLQQACRMKIQKPILIKYKYKAYTNTKQRVLYQVGRVGNAPDYHGKVARPNPVRR